MKRCGNFTVGGNDSVDTGVGLAVCFRSAAAFQIPLLLLFLSFLHKQLWHIKELFFLCVVSRSLLEGRASKQADTLDVFSNKETYTHTILCRINIFTSRENNRSKILQLLCLVCMCEQFIDASN